MAFKQLIATRDLPGLNAGPRPGVETPGNLALKLDPWFADAQISTARQPLLRCAALLWHDHQDEAHELAQDDHSSEGSLLHAILHRREPDYWNAKYWFRRAGIHPCFIPLGQALAALLQGEDGPVLNVQLMPGGIWDPLGFVEAVEQAAKLPAPHARTRTLQHVQSLEFDCLAEHLLTYG